MWKGLSISYGKASDHCTCTCDVSHVMSVVQVKSMPAVCRPKFYVCHPTSVDKVKVCHVVALVCNVVSADGSKIVSSWENNVHVILLMLIMLKQIPPLPTNWWMGG